MGLLKHFLLPLYALLGLEVVFMYFVVEEMPSELLEGWDRDDISVSPITPFEKHLYHVGGGAMVVLLVNNIAAIFVENSHYRGMAVLLHTLFFVVNGYSYVRLGVDIPLILYVLVGSGMVGMAIHSREPGIFQKIVMIRPRVAEGRWEMYIFYSGMSRSILSKWNVTCILLGCLFT